MFRLFFLSLFALIVREGASFGFTPLRFVRREPETSLFGWFDFNPIQGGGSAKDDLDEQWEAQQAILRARRGEFTKDQLKTKYSKKGGSEDSDDIPSAFESKSNPSHFDYKDDAMHFAAEKPQKQSQGFKLPWEN